MVRKRKAPKADTVAGEDSACPETSGVENVSSHTHHKSNGMENVDGSSSEELNAMVGDVVIRSGSPKKQILPEGREEETVVENVNLGETSKGEARDPQNVMMVPGCERNLEEVVTQNDTAPSAGGLSSDELNLMVGDAHVVIRSPGRPKKTMLPEGREEEPNVENVNLVGTSKGEAKDHQKVGTVPVCEGNLEEEATENQQHKTGPSVWNSEPVAGRPHEGPSSDLNYRTLYLDSVKKIESLMEQHYELVKELEFTCGKIDTYEKMSNTMAFPKGVMLVLMLEKDMEDQSQKLTSGLDSNADE